MIKLRVTFNLSRVLGFATARWPAAMAAAFCLATAVSPESVPAAGSAGITCILNPGACTKSVSLVKAATNVVVSNPGTPVNLTVPIIVFVTCPLTNNGGGICTNVGGPVSASLTASLYPGPCPSGPPLSPPTASGTISTAGGTMTLPTCAPLGSGFNTNAVPVTLPAGTPPGMYCVIGTVTITFADGMVLTQTGDTVVCVVDPVPGQPGVPRLNIELLSTPFPRMAPGDQHVATYRIRNNDPNNSVTLTAFAGARQAAVRPQGANEAQGVFTISNPFGDDFPIMFNPGSNSIPLPPHPYTQPEIGTSVPVIPPGQSTFVTVGIRSYGQCASGSGSESTLRVQGSFSDNTPALACAGFSFFVDTAVPSQSLGRQVNDCNNNGIPDALDIDAGRSLDRNFNAMPDECEQFISVPYFSSVTPTNPTPGTPIQVQVAFNEVVPMSNVWANGSSLMRTQQFGTPLWVGTVPADARPGPQTVYLLGKDLQGGLATSIATYTVSCTPPSVTGFTNQPQNQTVCAGGSATFCVGATGTAPLTYQWFYNGNPIAGATAFCYTRSGASPTDAGSYFVTVANACDSATSQVATLTVNTPPAITCPTNPIVATVPCGSNCVPVTYPAPTVVNGGLAGCTPPSGTCLPAGTHPITCTATNACGSNQCSFTVRVNPPPPAVFITCPTNPIVATVPCGSNCAPVVYPPPTVANGGLAGCNPPSGTCLAAGTSSVICTATNACGSNQCSFPVTVLACPKLTNCSSQGNCHAAYVQYDKPMRLDGLYSIVCSNTVSGVITPLVITGVGYGRTSNEIRLAVTPDLLPDTNVYFVAVLDAHSADGLVIDPSPSICCFIHGEEYPRVPGGRVSPDGTLFTTLCDVFCNPGPSDQTVVVGQAATFTATPDGTPLYNFQWLRNGVPIAGANGPSYTTAPALAAEDGTVYCLRLSNAFSSTLCCAMLHVRTPCTTEVIDFEGIVGAAESLPISTQFLDAFGVSFRRANGTFPLLARRGSPVAGFIYPNDSSPPTGDVLAPGDDLETRMSEYFLTLDGSINEPASLLIMDFASPVAQAGGYILDIDNQEKWIVKAYSDDGITGLDEVVLNWSDSNAGDGRSTPWRVSRPTADIRQIRFIPMGSDGGVGFDLFSFSSCPATDCIEIHCPTNMTVVTCGSNCVAVPFTVWATNPCTSNAVRVVTDFPSGYCFSPGTTWVHATAYDSGQTGECSFPITVLPNPNCTNGCSTNLLVNGSFEVPGVPDGYVHVWGGENVITGWKAVLYGVDYYNPVVAPLAVNTGAAADGNYLLNISSFTNQGSIAQSFDTVAGRTYWVEFSMGTSKERGRSGSVDLDAHVHDGDAFNLSWPYQPTGPVIASANFPMTTTQDHIVWERKRFEFVASSSRSTVLFSHRGFIPHLPELPPEFVNLDDVRVTDCPPTACQPAPAGLVAWWPGEGNALDAMGHYPGTVHGATFASAKAGQGFQFAGTDDYVSFGPDVGNFGTSDFTVELWLATTDTAHVQSVLGKRAECRNSHFWEIRMELGVVVAELDDGAGNYTKRYATHSIADGALHHVALVRQGTTVALYLDGALDATIYSPVADVDNTSPFELGRSPCIGSWPGDGTTFFNGVMDEVTLYSSALSAAEIQAIYAAGSLGKCPPPPCTAPPSGLVAWWRAEDNANDAVGGNHGTLVGGASFAPGRAGQAFGFDGVSGYVQVGPAPALRMVNAFTLEAWIYPTAATFGMIVNKEGEYELGRKADGTLTYAIANTFPGWTFIDTPGQAPLDTWTHVALTYDAGLGIANLYVNGTSVDSIPSIGPIGDAHPGTDDFRIGGRTVQMDFFQGRIDEVTLFNRSLSPLEVESLFGAGSAGMCPSNCLEITCPHNIRLPCEALDGTRVEYPTILASNHCNPADLVITCDPPSGSLFQPGKRTVRCQAAGSGQTTSCTFTVEILQILPLHIVPFGPDKFRLWWLRSCKEAILEQTPSLAEKPVWKRVPEPVQSPGDEDYVIVPFNLGDPAMFFRLRPADPGDLVLASDQIAIVAAEGVSSNQLAGVAQTYNLTLFRELPGGVCLFALPQRTDRAGLKILLEAIRQHDPQLIKQAGLVANPVGAQLPLIVTDEFIAQFHPNVDRAAIDALNAANGVEVVFENPFWKNQFLLRATAASTADAMELSGRYGQSVLVEYAEPNCWLFKDVRAVPNDPLFNSQWHVNNTGQGGGTPDADIDAPEAWDITTGSPAVVIADLDIGFDVTHPDLAPNLWTNPGEIPGNGIDDDGNGQRDDLNGWDFIRNNNNLTGDPHGTATAGCAGARGNNLLGVSGSCPDCRLMLVRTPASSTVMGDALSFDYARTMGTDVITCSWGYSINTALPGAVEAAINRAATLGRAGLGCVVLFAMNNPNVNDCGAVPDISSLANVLAVSRANNRDRFDRSGFGNCMDVLAPSFSPFNGMGTLGITTTDVAGTPGYNNASPPSGVCPGETGDRNYTMCFNGTSAATPITAGIAGLILSANPNLTRLQVQQLLQDTCDKIEDSAGNYSTTTGFSTPPSGIATHGYGRVNAFEAVRVAAPVASGGHGGVDIFLRDNRLDWGNTEQPSYVLFEPTRGYIEHFVSVDIKVDAPPFAESPPTTAAEFDAFPDENPEAATVNRVYVRVHNRGAAPADLVTVNLYWAYAGAGLPALPADFWDSFPGYSPDTSRWHPLGIHLVTGLGYSGTSVAGSSADASQIVPFDFPAPPLDPTVEDEGARRHHCLFAIIDSPQDPVSAHSRGLLVPDEITPWDNNVTHRNVVLQDPMGGGTRSERFYARNPYDHDITTRLVMTGPTNLPVSLLPTPFDQWFLLPSQAEVLFTVRVSVLDTNVSGRMTVLQEWLDGNAPRVLGGLAFDFVPGQNPISNRVCVGFQDVATGDHAQPLAVGELTFQVDRGFPDALIRIVPRSPGGLHALDAGFETVIQFPRPCRAVWLEVEPTGSAMDAQAFNALGEPVAAAGPVGPDPGMVRTLTLRGAGITRVHLKAPMDQSYLQGVCYEE